MGTIQEDVEVVPLAKQSSTGVLPSPLMASDDDLRLRTVSTHTTERQLSIRFSTPNTPAPKHRDMLRDMRLMPPSRSVCQQLARHAKAASHQFVPSCFSWMSSYDCAKFQSDAVVGITLGVFLVPQGQPHSVNQRQRENLVTRFCSC